MAATRANVRDGIATMGPEPVATGQELTQSELGRNLTWYNYVYDHDDAKRFLIQWAKATKNENIKELSKINARRMAVVNGWIARMVSNGLDLPKSSLDRFNAYIQSVVTSPEKEEEEVTETGEVVHVASTPSETLKFVMVNILKLTSPFNLTEYLGVNRVTKPVTQALVYEFESITEALKGQIIDLTDKLSAYDAGKLATIEKKRKQYQFGRDILAVCEAHLGKAAIAPVTRKPRKIKPKTPQQLLKNFKFLESKDELKSIDPTKIIGATVLYALNTKNNVLSVFKAKDDSGLSVSRTSITGYDEKESGLKRVGRHLGKVLPVIQLGSKAQRLKVLESVPSEFAVFTDRLNENTILLRVEK